MDIKIEEYYLDNNIKVILIPIQTTDIVSVGLFSKVGSRNEDKKNSGIAHFLEHMIFKGTKNMTSQDVVSRLDNMGAIYNAETSYETTCYYVYGYKDNINNFIDILSEIYINPAFREEDIMVERGVILEELNMIKEDSMEIIHNMINEHLFTNSSLKYPIIGTKKNIMSFKRKDFLQFRKENYNLDNTVLVVAGNFKKKNILEKIKKLEKKKYEKNEKKDLIIKKIEKQLKPELYYKEKKDLSQSVLAITFRSESLYSKNNETYDILGDILSSGFSSRLTHILRTKMGIIYNIHAVNVAFIEEGVFIIYMGIDNKNIEKAIKVVLEELLNIKKNGCTTKELEKAKNIRETQFLLTTETPHDMMRYYGLNELYYKVGVKKEDQKDYSIKSMIKLYNKIEKKDIDNLTKTLFVPENLNIFIYGSKKTVDLDDLKKEINNLKN